MVHSYDVVIFICDIFFCTCHSGNFPIILAFGIQQLVPYGKLFKNEHSEASNYLPSYKLDVLKMV